MKNTIALIASALLFASLANAGHKNTDTKKADQKYESVSDQDKKDADAAVDRIYKADAGIKKLIDKAYAYAIYPTVGKGGAAVGGAYGKGYVYEKGLVGYSLVGTSELTQVTIGVQLGGQTFSQLVVFENKDTFNSFKKGTLQPSSQASAVAIKSGATANASFKNGVAIFTFAEEGLMGELSVGGQVLSFKAVK